MKYGRTADLKQNGFSMVEFLVAMVLCVLVLLGLCQTITSSQKIYVSQEELAALSQQGRATMDNMVRTIRRAGSNPMDTAFSFASDPDSLPIPIAEENAIQILADLPQDVMDDSGASAPDGDDVDFDDLDTDEAWDNDENENGDGVLDDADEDITFCLVPSDSNLVPTGTGPWVLVKRIPDGAGGDVDIPLASNVTQLEFRYILKVNATGDPNLDTRPLSFAERWDNSAGAAENSSSYTGNDRRFIKRILIRMTLQTSNPDRTTKDFRTLTLEEDIGIRVRS
jgi:type II secretory pathway pseudopilin PulG